MREICTSGLTRGVPAQAGTSTLLYIYSLAFTKIGKRLSVVLPNSLQPKPLQPWRPTGTPVKMIETILVALFVSSLAATGAIFLNRKAKYWEYEHEWRLLELTKRTGNDTLVLPSGALTGIILGCAIPSTLPSTIADWNCERRNPLVIYEATKHQDVYGLRIGKWKQATKARTVPISP